MSELGDRIRIMRKLRGYTIEELARLVGGRTHRSHISQIESGRVTSPGYNTVQRIAGVLEVSTAALTGEAALPPADKREEVVAQFRQEADEQERESPARAQRIRAIARLLETDEDAWVGFVKALPELDPSTQPSAQRGSGSER